MGPVGGRKWPYPYSGHGLWLLHLGEVACLGLPSSGNPAAAHTECALGQVVAPSFVQPHHPQRWRPGLEIMSVHAEHIGFC